MSTPEQDSDSAHKKMDSSATLKEVKYSLSELLNEAEDERSASSMAKQIIDQSEIQKMVSDQKKRSGHG